MEVEEALQIQRALFSFNNSCALSRLNHTDEVQNTVEAQP